MRRIVVSCVTAFFMSVSLAFAQTNQAAIRLRHNVSPLPPLYIVDGLKLDSNLFFRLSFNRDQIKKVIFVADAKKYGNKGQYGVIEIYTKLLMILNKVGLADKEDKWENLATVQSKQITALVQMGAAEATKLYGKRGKYGAVLVSTEELKKPSE